VLGGGGEFGRSVNSSVSSRLNIQMGTDGDTGRKKIIQTNRTQKKKRGRKESPTIPLYTYTGQVGTKGREASIVRRRRKYEKRRKVLARRPSKGGLDSREREGNE